jgi:hypothetical protein
LDAIAALPEDAGPQQTTSVTKPRIRMLIHDWTARYPNFARQCGGVPPLAWRVLTEGAASLRIPI